MTVPCPVHSGLRVDSCGAFLCSLVLCKNMVFLDHLTMKECWGARRRSLTSRLIFFLGVWKCDMGKIEVPLEELCKDFHCQDQTDTSFCECGRGKWRCPADGKYIKDTQVCDRSREGCHCVECSDEEEHFCNLIWQCPFGSNKVKGM